MPGKGANPTLARSAAIEKERSNQGTVIIELSSKHVLIGLQSKVCHFYESSHSIIT
jgi:hypothetical protein